MADSEKASFEVALQRLEEIVKTLESGDLTLDGALEFFEEGVRLSQRCAALLDDAEKRVEIVTQGKDGGTALTEAPFGRQS